MAVGIVSTVRIRTLRSNEKVRSPAPVNKKKREREGENIILSIYRFVRDPVRVSVYWVPSLGSGV